MGLSAVSSCSIPDDDVLHRYCRETRKGSRYSYRLVELSGTKVIISIRKSKFSLKFPESCVFAKMKNHGKPTSRRVAVINEQFTH